MNLFPRIEMINSLSDFEGLRVDPEKPEFPEKRAYSLLGDDSREKQRNYDAGRGVICARTT